MLRPVAAVSRAALEFQYLQPARNGLGNLLAQFLGARVWIEQAVAQEGEQVLELERFQFIPEPVTMSLLSLGLVGLAWWRRRRTLAD